MTKLCIANGEGLLVFERKTLLGKFMLNFQKTSAINVSQLTQ